VPDGGTTATAVRAALLATLAADIAALGPGHPVRVAIDGVDAAGKTTLIAQTH
jgi:hypothetical protein